MYTYTYIYIRQLRQAAVLEQLFVFYARVVKKNPAGALMPLVLQVP